MKSNYILAVGLILISILCFLTEHILFIISGVIMTGLALYVLKPIKIEHGYERTNVYTAPKNKKNNIEFFYENLPIDSHSKTNGHSFVYTDDDGIRHEYSSLKEMPPEIRRLFKKS